MKSLLKLCTLAIQRARLAMAEADLQWMETAGPVRIREQRTRVGELAAAVSRIEAPTTPAASAEDVRYLVERKLKGALL